MSDWAQFVRDNPDRVKGAQEPKKSKELPPWAGMSKSKIATDQEVRHAYVLSKIEEHGLPVPEWEYEFHHERRWRVDYVWNDPDIMVAWEINGGIYSNGGHVRGKHLEGEYQKLTALAAYGYRTVICTPRDCLEDEWYERLRRALYG